MQVLGGQEGCFQKFGLETSDMTSEGLGEMYEGHFADTCTEKWGAEGRVECAETRERGPPSAPAESPVLLALFSVL